MIPPPPDYAPTVGRPTTWWTTDDTPAPAVKPQPEPQPAAGPDYRAIAAAIADHTRTTLTRPASDRARRLRKWALLTACSATIGYALYLPQLLDRATLPLQIGAWLTAWGLDLWTREWGTTRVSDITGPWPITLTILARVPLASALIAALNIY